METNKMKETSVIKEIMTTELNVIKSWLGAAVDVGEFDSDDPDEEATVGGRVIVDFLSSGLKKLIPSPNLISWIGFRISITLVVDSKDDPPTLDPCLL